MSRTTLVVGLTIVIAWCWTSPAPATLYIYEPFNYSFYVTGIPIYSQVYDGSTNPRRSWQFAANDPTKTVGISIANGGFRRI
jgi:hypothetical protein